MRWLALLLIFIGARAALGQTIEPNDPFFASKSSWGQAFADQWALPRIGFTARGSGSAWDIETGRDRPVTVAVLDTGLDYLHPDFSSNSLWRNPAPTSSGQDRNGYVNDVFGWNFVEDTNNPWDNDGHGTFVAGLIGAAANNGRGIAGINWGARIMPLKTMNAFGRGRAFHLARAIVYAADRGAKVINLSLEGEKLTRTEQIAIDYAHAKGALLVVAAGNKGSETVEKVAAFRRVLPVAALNAQDKRAGFSNWGKHIRIAAPGTDILSLRARRSDFMLLTGVKNYQAGDAFVGPQNQLMRASGTSFAAPLVSAVASLIWAKYPNLTNVQVERMLLMSADDVEAPGWDQLSGYGRVNARKALVADPDYFLYVEAHRAAPHKEGSRTVLQLFGTVQGSHFEDYHLEVGQGDDPNSWKRAGKPAGQPVADGVIGTFTLQDFGAPGRWTIRVISRDTKGTTRESRISITLQ